MIFIINSADDRQCYKADDRQFCKELYNYKYKSSHNNEWINYHLSLFTQTCVKIQGRSSTTYIPKSYHWAFFSTWWFRIVFECKSIKIDFQPCWFLLAYHKSWPYLSNTNFSHTKLHISTNGLIATFLQKYFVNFLHFVLYQRTYQRTLLYRHVCYDFLS